MALSSDISSLNLLDSGRKALNSLAQIQRDKRFGGCEVTKSIIPSQHGNDSSTSPEMLRVEKAGLIVPQNLCGEKHNLAITITTIQIPGKKKCYQTS